MALPLALLAGVQVIFGILAAVIICPAVIATPESLNVPVLGRVVIITLANALAGVSFTSLKPKSATAKLMAVSSSVVMVLSAPAGASFTELMVIVTVEVFEILDAAVPPEPTKGSLIL